MKTSLATQERTPKSKTLPYDIIQDEDTYHIVFNLPESFSTRLICSLNKLGRKVVVVLNNSGDLSTFHYPCIFSAPHDADLDEVRIRSRKSIHMISIPKIRRESRNARTSDYIRIESRKMSLS
jgi:hypothetical protein